MPGIQIRVGASVDTNLGAVIGTITNAARRAREATASEAKKAADAQSKEADRAAKAASRAYAKMEADAARLEQKTADAADRAAQRKVRADQRAFDARVKAATRAAEAEERAILRVAATAEKAAQRKVDAERKAADAARANLGRATVSTFGRVAGAAGRLGMGVAQGAGVETSLGAMVGKAVNAERIATNLVNSAAAAEGRQARPGEAASVVSHVRGVAQRTGADTTGAMEGLGEFVARSSDLKTGVESLEQLAVLSRATGTNLKDMVAAAGEVNTQLADGPDKAERLLAVMRALSKQGALGAVEIKDLAKYAGRLTGSAGRFAGGYEGNVATLGTLAQLAKHGGGASTAAEATNSAAAFARDLTKGSVLKKWKAQGIEVFDKEGNINDPRKLIGAALFRTGGDQAKLAGLMPNVVMQRGVLELAKKYRDAERTKKGSGLEAVEAEFAKFATGMSKEDVFAAFKQSMETSEAKVAQFNAKLEETAAKLAATLLPKMEQLAPIILQLADAFTTMLGVAASNPGETIVAAITASIAEAAIGEAVGKSLTTALGGLGGALVIPAAAFTIAEGILMVARMNEAKGVERAATETETTEYHLKQANKELADKGELSPELRQQLQDDLARRQQEIGNASGQAQEGKGGWSPKNVYRNVRAFMSKDYAESVGETNYNAEHIGELIGEVKGLKAAIEADQKSVKKVHVVNQPGPGGKGTKVDGGGRSDQGDDN